MTTDLIRLAVSGDGTVARQLGGRLRDASVESIEAQLPDACDAALFLDPQPAEAELIRHCLSRGKHLLLTPRSWLSVHALAQLSAAARQSAVQLAVENADRFLPSRQLIRQQLDAGRLGEPGLVRVHRWEHAHTEGEGGDVPLALTQDIDTAVWLMGSAPDVVYAVQRAGGTGGRSAQVHLGFPGGGMALIDYTNQMPPGDGYRSLSLIGSVGAAYADDHQNMQLVYRGGHPQAVRVDEGVMHIVALVQEFVSGLRERRDLSAGLASWRTALAVAEAARRSLASQRAVSFEGR